MRGLFVTGTDTGVGKTAVAAAIVRFLVIHGFKVGALKPVATGAEQLADGSLTATDTVLLSQSLGRDVPPYRITPMALPCPLAPAVAARIEGRPLAHVEIQRAVHDALSWWSSRADVMIVEGVGGLLCPLAINSTVVDLAGDLDFPLVIVARRGLGTLNHTLLTVAAARSRGLRIAGLVLNASEPETNSLAELSNPGELAARLGLVPILAMIPHQAGIVELSDLVGDVDWYERAQPSRRFARGETWP
jgi:dethiobiotin synthetase